MDSFLPGASGSPTGPRSFPRLPTRRGRSAPASAQLGRRVLIHRDHPILEPAARSVPHGSWRRDRQLPCSTSSGRGGLDIGAVASVRAVFERQDLQPLGNGPCPQKDPAAPRPRPMSGGTAARPGRSPGYSTSQRNGGRHVRPAHQSRLGADAGRASGSAATASSLATASGSSSAKSAAGRSI